MAHTPGPNSSQLRDDIDQGRTGDKSPGFDPAAAPLGVDEEAGGAGPTAAEVAAARRAERRPGLAARRPNAAEPALAPDGALPRSPAGPGHWILVAVIAVVLAATVLFTASYFANLLFGLGGV